MHDTRFVEIATRKENSMPAQSEVYIISGAKRGIGFELTRQLLAEGQTVIVGARNIAKAEKLSELAAKSEGRLLLGELDVGSDQSVAQFVKNLKVDRVDTLINNAGVYLDHESNSTSVAPSRVMETLNVNTLGPMRLTQSLLPKLLQSANPCIANISSLMGSIGDNKSGSSAGYRMSKTALNMFVKTLALDVPKLTVLALHPGWVKTEMGGEMAPVMPADSARGLLDVIKKAKITGTAMSGHFYNYDGHELPW
jgi:NAD(P)-dependent dehydrogenase (short-subunit alcohol dehydrogenase family)